MIDFLSEIAPATASAIAQLLPKYLDQVAVFPVWKGEMLSRQKLIQMLDIQACIKVVEGGVPETTALLKVMATTQTHASERNIFIRSVLTNKHTQLKAIL